MRGARVRWIRGAMRRMRVQRGDAALPILVRRSATAPEVTLLRRAGLVLLLVASVFVVFLLDRAGLRDQIDGHVSVKLARVGGADEIVSPARFGGWRDASLRIEAGDRVLAVDGTTRAPAER